DRSAAARRGRPALRLLRGRQQAEPGRRHERHYRGSRLSSPRPVRVMTEARPHPTRESPEPAVPAAEGWSAELPNLRPMLEEIDSAPEIVRPSMFWDSLNERNLRQLEESGFRSFKQTVNRNYFQFLPADPRNEQFRGMMWRWLR